MPNLTWKTQNALRIKLRRLGLQHPASLASLLLEAFVEGGGIIPARAYYGSDHETKGMKYQSWIESLIHAGLIEPFKSEDSTRKGDDWVKFRPGKVIRDYVNKEKSFHNEMASMRDIYEAEARVDARKADRSELLETKQMLEATSEELKATKEELAKTNQVVARIAKAVRKLQKAKEPPVTPEKLELQRQAEQELEEHTRAMAN